ncbi:hypothetical protein PLICRDRAFT_50232 [Plicaturopsis crispa FD-325 SS-3]|nr:hypothetical protein PLICRDRAFT_50232 [Plicaturopsis crispa FD-325 SS-3]
MHSVGLGLNHVLGDSTRLSGTISQTRSSVHGLPPSPARLLLVLVGDDGSHYGLLLAHNSTSQVVRCGAIPSQPLVVECVSLPPLAVFQSQQSIRSLSGTLHIFAPPPHLSPVLDKLDQHIGHYCKVCFAAEALLKEDPMIAGIFIGLTKLPVVQTRGP